MKKTLIVWLMLFSSYSFAAMNPCEVEVMGSLQTEDDPDPYYKIGDTIKGITQYWFDVETQESVFCQKGGYCYPRYKNVDGNNIELLKLKQCVIGKAEINEHSILYSLIPDRSSIPSTVLKKHDVSNRLADIGIGLAIADNAAEYYIKKPESKCGLLTKQVLEGNKEAFNELSSGQKYCNWDW